MRQHLLWLSVIALASCNSYDYFRQSGQLQESFSGRADILFVIDNSGSMAPRNTALAENLSAFIDGFADTTPPPTDPTLSDDVARFVEFLNDPTQNLNYQLGVTTTDVAGVSGQLLGNPTYLAKSDDNVADRFNRNLLCDAACVDDIPNSIDISCNGVSESCEASDDNSREEVLEAAFMAMCRAVESPPSACFQEWWNDGEEVTDQAPRNDTGGELGVPALEYFSDADIGSNAGFLRENSTLIVVVVTDEGDKSRRLTARDASFSPYDQLFSQFSNRITWAIIGSPYSTDVPGEPSCNLEGVRTDLLDRYHRMVESTNGVYIDMFEPNPGGSGLDACRTTDFGEALNRIGELLRALTDNFSLQAIPVVDTITVAVDGVVIPEADASFNEDLGIITYSDGWSYNSETNAVVLHGDAVPGFDAQVRVWYLPASALPRELPF